MSVSSADSTDKPEERDADKEKTDKERKVSSRQVSSSDIPEGASNTQASPRNSSGANFDKHYDKGEKPRTAAMEVLVDNNIEKAMKVLKRKLIKEGLFKELKSRRYYEKPSEKRKRKHKESVKKIRKEEMRQKRGAFLFS